MKILLGIILLVTIRSEACWWGTAESTIYYTPDAKKICGRYGSKCKDFVDIVELQGSGKLSHGKVLTYTGETREIPEDCPTTTGAYGVCLIPYVSVAADARYYNGGDIISMPGMAGKKVRAPDGTIVSHPGYFLVHDTGGAIDGRNRFDFYTGLMGPSDRHNSFGYKGLPQTVMHDKEGCVDRKKFDRVTPKNKSYAEIKKSIDTFSKIMLNKTELVSGDNKNSNIKKPSKSKVTN